MSEPSTYERKEIHHTRDMSGGGWKEVIAELLREEVARRGQSGSTERGIPVTFLLGANDEPDCVCIRTVDKDGTEVCVCYGNCPDFPDCCDDTPIFTEG